MRTEAPKDEHIKRGGRAGGLANHEDTLVPMTSASQGWMRSDDGHTHEWVHPKDVCVPRIYLYQKTDAAVNERVRKGGVLRIDAHKNKCTPRMYMSHRYVRFKSGHSCRWAHPERRVPRRWTRPKTKIVHPEDRRVLEIEDSHTRGSESVILKQIQ